MITLQSRYGARDSRSPLGPLLYVSRKALRLIGQLFLYRIVTASNWESM